MAHRVDIMSRFSGHSEEEEEGWEERGGHTSNISSQCWLMSCFAAEMDELMSVVTRVLVTRTLVTSWHRGLTSRHSQANNQIILAPPQVKIKFKFQVLARSRFGLDVTKNQWVFYKSVTVYLYPSKGSQERLRRHKLNICLLKLL